MLKKQFFNMLIITSFSISVMSTSLFSMKTPKIQIKKEESKKLDNNDNHPSSTINNQASVELRSACCICDRAVHEQDEAKQFICNHKHHFHDTCLEDKTFCPMCERNRELDMQGGRKTFGDEEDEPFRNTGAFNNNHPANNNPNNNDNNRSWLSKLKWPRIAMVATCVILCGVFASKWFGWR